MGVGCNNGQYPTLGLNRKNNDNQITANDIKTATSPDPYAQDEAFSSDKNFRAFIKDNPDRDTCDETGCAWQNEIWISDVKGGTSQPLISSGNIAQYSFVESKRFPFSAIHSLRNPVFSLDGKKLYFLSFAWTTSPAVFSVDIITKKLDFISSGLSLDIITKGKYRSLLIVAQHRYYGPPDYGSYDHYYIINDKGEEVKDLGDDFSKFDTELGLNQ